MTRVTSESHQTCGPEITPESSVAYRNCRHPRCCCCCCHRCCYCYCWEFGGGVKKEEEFVVLDLWKEAASSKEHADSIASRGCGSVVHSAEVGVKN